MQKRWWYGRFVACCVKHTGGCVGIFCIEIQKTTESNLIKNIFIIKYQYFFGGSLDRKQLI